MSINAPLPARETQAPFVLPFGHAANADGGAVVTKIATPDLPFVVDKVKYLNVTGLAEHASNYGLIVVQHPQVIADHVVSAVDVGDNELEFAAPHSFETGDGPIRLTTTAADAPDGLATGTDYFVVKSSASALKLATSLDNALRGSVIDIVDAGTGVHTLIDQAGTKRVIAYLNTDSDLPGSNSLAANTQVDLTLNAATARVCDADTVLEVLVADIGTTTIPVGSGVIQGRLLK